MCAMIIEAGPFRTATASKQSPQKLTETLRLKYRDVLFKQVLPFWMRHGSDREYGGIGNILDEDGNTISHDKYLWSQGRALWTFSALCNHVEERPEWRAFADHIFAYLRTHGRDAEGRWMYRLDRNGGVLDGAVNIYVDGFVLHGLTEYYRLSGNPEALALALNTYGQVQARLCVPGGYDVFPFHIPEGMRTLDVPMAFSWFFYNLGEAASRPDILQAGVHYAEEILTRFYHPGLNVILQYVPWDGGFSDDALGRTYTPGTVFEAMWFGMNIFDRMGREDRIAQCCAHLKRHLNLAWDVRYGGFPLVVDVDGKHPAGAYKTPDCKPWWVQVEALVATAYAWHYTGEQWCLDWHEKIRQWVFALYPHASGEWRQWLDRKGNPMPSEALPVKDPFHLPRALLQMIRIFK